MVFRRKAGFMKKERLKKETKRLCSILLCVSFLLNALFAVPAPAYAAEAAGSSFVTGSYRLAAGGGSASDLTDTFIYSDSYFTHSSYEADPHLATVSMCAAAASCGSPDEADYAGKSSNLRDLMADLGFSDFETNAAYREKPAVDSLGVAGAHKTITADGSTYTLLAFMPRSGGYEREWASNFLAGTEGTLAGFTAARDILLDFARSYIKTHAISGNVKVWLPGYSRGAAAANLAGAALTQDSSLLGISVKPEDVYTYTFESPLCVPLSLDPQNSVYGSIHNYYEDYDLVTMFAPEQWGFSRYGTNIALPVHDADAKKLMLGFLEQINSALYKDYTAEGSSADPDCYSPKKISLENGGQIINDTDDYSITEKTQKAFLTARLAALTSTLIPDRTAYASRYQSAIMSYLSVFMGMTDQQLNALVDSLKGQSDTLLFLMLHLSTYYSRKSASKDCSRQLESVHQDLDPLLKESLPAAGVDVSTVTALTDSSVTDPLIDLIACILFDGNDTMHGMLELFNFAATAAGCVSGIVSAHRGEIVLSWLKTQDTYYTKGIPAAVTASANEAGAGTITGTGTVAYDGSTTLTAVPAVGYRFVNWLLNGVAAGTEATLTVTNITANLSYTAVFEKIPESVTAAVNEAGAGKVTGSGTVEYGGSTVLTAVPAAGYRFVNWLLNGAVAGTEEVLAVNGITADLSYTAVFEQIPAAAAAGKESASRLRNPDTGDNSQPLVLPLLAAVSALLPVLFLRKRQK